MIQRKRNDCDVSKKANPILDLALPGAGKTTFSRKLEQERAALRLTPDEWMARIVGSGGDEKRRAEVEAIMGAIAEKCLSLGINVILDFRFWSRPERDEYRARAQKLGVSCELYFLDVPLEELLSGPHERNLALPVHTFSVTEEQLKLWSTLFEAPTEYELSIPLKFDTM